MSATISFAQLCDTIQIPEGTKFTVPASKMHVCPPLSIPEGEVLTVLQANYRFSVTAGLQIPYSVWTVYKGERITIQLKL